MDFGLVSWAPTFEGPALARDAEERGFAIRYFGDNTCFAGDPFAELRDAARATTTIKLACGVTNTVTKHPSVIASAIAPVQLVSGGRAICGLGKGDSSMGVLGRGPQRHAEFVEGARSLRAYLRGEPQDLNGWQSRIEWLDRFPDYRPVPLEIMASGPKTLRAAGQIADRVTLATGGHPDRVAWALSVVDEGLADSGRDRTDIEIGGFFEFAIDDDPEHAAEKLRARTHALAHMASFPGADLSAQPEILRSATEVLRNEYSYRNHNNHSDNPQREMVTAEFATWFAIGGSVAHVVDRIGQLADAGISYLMMAEMAGPDWDVFTGEVIPQARAIAVRSSR